MNNKPELIVEQILDSVKNDFDAVFNMLYIDFSDPSVKENHSKIISEAWVIVEGQFLKKWTPKLNEEEEEELISYLKQKMSIHSIKELVRDEFKI